MLSDIFSPHPPTPFSLPFPLFLEFINPPKTCYKNRSFTTRQGFEYSLSLHCFCVVGLRRQIKPLRKRQEQKYFNEVSFYVTTLQFCFLLYLCLPLDGPIGLQSGITWLGLQINTGHKIRCTC